MATFPPTPRFLPRTRLGLQSGDFLFQFLPLLGGDPIDDFLVLLDFPDTSKVARYRRERMSMGCES